MQIDWMSRGMMMTRITRGCANRKVDEPEPVCKEGATSLAQFKDCDVVCNEAGCNKGNLSITLIRSLTVFQVLTK